MINFSFNRSFFLFFIANFCLFTAWSSAWTRFWTWH